MAIPEHGQTFDSADDKLRFECKPEIEQMWMSGEDPKAVHRLARAAFPRPESGDDASIAAAAISCAPA
ncbi:MAG: hypothetical protein ABI442_21595 [Gemmatimonadaceae bacterium]